MPTVLGEGSYGQVIVRDGKAVKKFSKLSHLIQEYFALQYLRDCTHVVHSAGVDFERLELHMELYDSSLRDWMHKKIQHGGPKDDEIMEILKHILIGLAELHDRNLAHGDLKPGNVLVKNKPLRVVLGDCGFVSVAKYAKTERTAAVYRDPVVSKDASHDMFSFGICFMEMVSSIKINKQASYAELRSIVKSKVKNATYRKLIYNLVNEDKERRPSARSVLETLFNVHPPAWVPPHIEISSLSQSDSSNAVRKFPNEECRKLRKIMKTKSREYQIKRGQKSYGAVLGYILDHNIEASEYMLYCSGALMIASTMFDTPKFRESEAMKMAGSKYSIKHMYAVLEALLADANFINILLRPTKE